MIILPSLDEAIAAAAAGYYRLALLVGPPASGKTRRLRDLAQIGDLPLLSISGLAAAQLLELPSRQRQQRVGDVISGLVDATSAPVVLLDNLELLFEPSLQLDPMRLLQSLSRDRTIVASWPGRCVEEVLTYGSSDHPEFRSYRRPEAIIVPQTPLLQS